MPPATTAVPPTVFAARVRHLRRVLGLTRQSLADMLGVSTQTVGNWERGRCEPSVSQGRALAAALGVTLDALLATTDGEPRVPP